ncbi:MAG TPA: DUF4265 domain-containing protein [Pyrinomonadaceae bacterium]|nr:DUF4265 domain-containing protein [Pyrinomonadaceae bacterium]
MTAHKQHNLSPVEKLVKVTFELDQSDWHDHATETMWAVVVAERTYVLRNVPFYVYGVSYADLVVAEQTGGENLFRRVYQRGGHSTYRIFLVDEEAEQEFESAWQPLASLGCTYERATDYLVAVDVPPESDIYGVYSALEKGLEAGAWDFEEGHCGHALS